MSKKQTYAVFGLGRYGRTVATELADHGEDVIAIDRDESAVNAVSQILPICKCADVTDREVLKQLDIASVDVVIIAMSGSLEASVLSTMLCKEEGVKTVIAKCSDETHRKILTRVGADKVVFPETESGQRLAKNLISDGFVDIIDLSTDVSMLEMDVKREWVGKTLIELNLRQKYSINVVGIRRQGKVCIDIDPQEPLAEDMQLFVIANTEKLSKLK